MPNGYHNNSSIDLFIHRHTEHGNPRFVTHSGSAGLVAVHMEHDRGYAYLPRWEDVYLASLVHGQRQGPTREEMNALAAELVEKVLALLSSNPSSVVRADRASALLARGDFCVVFGGYYLYTRPPNRRFQLVEPPVGYQNKGVVELIEAKPELESVARDTHVVAKIGLSMHEPSQCVVDLNGVTEWIASTAPLHQYALWEEIARVPLDAVESGGHTLRALREHATAKGTDHIVIRCRRPASKEAAGPARRSDDTTIGGDLRVLQGAEMGRPYFLFEEAVIGRAKTCTIALDDDSASRQHARITRAAGGYLLTDLGSTNGTFINGRQVSKQILVEGDHVSIGDHRFRFHSGHQIIYEPHPGQPNDRGILAALEEEWPKAAEREVSVVVFDLDRLHRLNATLGFLAGDAVLKHVESVARAALRPEDTLSRIGGEEFAFVLPGLGAEAAREAADALRRAIDASIYIHEGQEAHITISGGVATYSERTKRPWQLLRQAWGCLDEAKARGRNRVV